MSAQEVLANVSAVSLQGRALLIEGPSGSGKSSLALALIDRGAVLIGDDAVTIAASDGRCLVSPPPRIAGLIEVRNIGLVTLPTAVAPLALVLSLDPGAPRYPLEDRFRRRAGCDIPLIAFAPGDAVQALRAEYALEKHGLRFSRAPERAT